MIEISPIGHVYSWVMDQTSYKPIWIQDLVTCIIMTLENSDSIGKTLQLGGGESLSFLKIIEIIMDKI
jgi:nucleoside-diphosphate-sugar epimerase